jgi:7SK snRNA methylphosphate capping enzyme
MSKLKEHVYSRLNFRTENYISITQSAEVFDVIICLSTIKWVHLCFGDTGVKTLFCKAHSQLSEGGFFIFD